MPDERMAEALNDPGGFGGSLADLSVRLRGYAQTQSKLSPEARVRLERPLEAPPAVARLDALLGLSPAFVGGAHPTAPYAPSLVAFHGQISACMRCSLGGTRKKLIFGEGDPKASLVFVGAAPGGEEEAAGRPMVGPAGDLLDRMIAAMGVQRSDVYVCNVLKCRTQGAREPQPDEVAACRPYLEHQLSLLKPEVIIALGAGAVRLLLDRGDALAGLRGRWGSFQGVKVMPTYHPQDLLRDAGLKRHVWDDLKQVLKALLRD